VIGLVVHTLGWFLRTSVVTRKAASIGTQCKREASGRATAQTHLVPGALCRASIGTQRTNIQTSLGVDTVELVAGTVTAEIRILAIGTGIGPRTIPKRG
jgi:hypothetical protein